MAREEHPGAQQFLPSRPTLARMRKAIQECRGCDLYRDATQAVFGDGADKPALVMIGEQPGDVEDRKGEPFVGPAGRLLDKALDAAGIDTETVYRTNAVKHFRFRGGGGRRRIHTTPDRWQITACRPWLRAELELLRPAGVVVLGATAGQTLLGPSFRVGAMRGKVIEAGAELDCDWLVATTHPSAVLRASNREEALDALVADLRVAAQALAG